MSWRVEWDDDAQEGLREIPLDIGRELDAAVIHYAKTGRGLVFRVSRHDTNGFSSSSLAPSRTSTRMSARAFCGYMERIGGPN
jgi:hypothetical protein